jgi:hypothetical protein
MKKIYQTPQLKIVKLETRQMIATSIIIGDSYRGGVIQSRRGGGLWDEDEEDDEEYYY